MNANHYTRPVRRPLTQVDVEEPVFTQERHAPYLHQDCSGCTDALMNEINTGSWAAEPDLLSALSKTYFNNGLANAFDVYRHFHPSYQYNYSPYEISFSPIALPGSPHSGSLQTGDIVLLRIALSGKTVKAIITKPALLNKEALNGFSSAFDKRGFYVQAYGNNGNNGNEKMYLRVADMNNSTPGNVIILRVNPASDFFENRSVFSEFGGIQPDSPSELHDESEDKMQESDDSCSESMPTKADIDPKYGKVDYLDVSAVEGKSFKTGVFIPSGFSQTDKVDIIIFLHGKYPEDAERHPECYEKLGMEYYWENYSKIRQHFWESQRNAILLAPTLGKNPQDNDVNDINLKRKEGGLDKFINSCFIELTSKKYVSSSAQPSQIILAAHSAGGSVLSSILNSNNTLIDNITFIWGFDCLYGYPFDKWLQTQKSNKTDHIFYHYWAVYCKEPSICPKVRARILAEKYPDNFKNLDHKGHIKHQDIIEYAWKLDINRRSWFDPINIFIPVDSSSTVKTIKITEDKDSPIQPSFQLTKLSPSDTPVILVHEDKKAGLAEIKEPPSLFLKKIISMALGEDESEKWFDNFTRITFLGRQIKANEYIHIELANYLIQIEKDFSKKFGGVNEDPAVAGDYLLGTKKEYLKGSRYISQTAAYSYHMFGLAIDVNYSGNPFIQNKQRKGKNEKTKAEFIIPNGKLTMNKTLSNASKLYNRSEVRFEYGLSYNDYENINKYLISYLNLTDLNNETTLKDILQNTTSPEWQNITIDEARKRIQDDLEILSLALDRWESRDSFKLNGFLNLSKDFVEGIGLNWGAWYGDMMHFDMRTIGVGVKIEEAKQKYMKQKEAESREKYKSKS